MPVRMLITEGTTADCAQASKLINGINAEPLIADKAYDTHTLIHHCSEKNINPIIPPKKNRKVQRVLDKDLYQYRHLIENAFLHLKRWRGMATRYAKNTASFLAAVPIRCLVL